jgi:integrase
MIQQGIFEQYSEESSFNMNETSKRNISALLVRFFGLKPDVPYDNLTRQDLIDMFSMSSLMTNNTFNSYKSKINDFMKWMCETGNGTDAPMNQLRDIYFNDINRSEYYSKFYFRDYEDLLGYMKAAFTGRGTEFDTFRSAATLIWYGIDVNNLCDILKKDINEDENTVIHPVTGKPIKLCEIAMSVLVSYRDAESYDSNKFGGTTLRYQESEYLFRSYKNAVFSVKQFNSLVTSANKAAADIGKIFRWNRIYLSGLYYRIHQYEDLNGKIDRTDYDTIKKLFGMTDIQSYTTNTRHILSSKYDEYAEFRDFMYN